MLPLGSEGIELVLASTARMMEDGSGRLRIRTGVWNFEEAIIDVGQESPAVARTVRAALRALGSGPMRLSEHLDTGLLPIERANVEKLFTDLTQAGVLVSVTEQMGQEAVTAALLGRLTSPYPGAATPPEKPVVFLTDCPAAQAQAESLAVSLRMRLVAPTAEAVRLLETADLTSRVDGYQTELDTERLRAAFADVAAVVTCHQRPSLPVLRNLNRALEGRNIPWVSGFIDGPFISVVGLKPPYTGCFECFEQRALARLEDHVAYHDFARSPAGQPIEGTNDAPMMHLLTVLAVTEGYLHAAVGTSRLAGRVLGVHLPTLEIQTQDLLRMPTCPACGRVAQQQLKEINFNSRTAVDRIVSEVLRW